MFNYLKIMIKCRFFCMRILLFLILLLFNFSNHVTSCPSSGDGDCVPSTDAYDKGSNKDKNQANKEKSQAITETSEQNTSSGYDSYESDDGLPDDHIAKPSSYLKKINEKSILNSKISKLNFDLDNIIYNSSKKYNSNFSSQINDKLYDVNNLIVQNKNIDKNFFNSLNQNIDKLLNTIIYSFNDDNSFISKPNKKSVSDIMYQINKYNEINDIIKTLEIMN